MATDSKIYHIGIDLARCDSTKFTDSRRILRFGDGLHPKKMERIARLKSRISKKIHEANRVTTDEVDCG